MLKTIILKTNIHWCTLQASDAIVALRSSGIYAEGLPIRYENSELPTAHLFFTSIKLSQIIGTYLSSGSALQRHPSGPAFTIGSASELTCLREYHYKELSVVACKHQKVDARE
jgi:hypothetical protein